MQHWDSGFIVIALLSVFGLQTAYAQNDRPPATSIERAKTEYAETVARARDRLLASFDRAIADSERRGAHEESLRLAEERADLILNRGVPVRQDRDPLQNARVLPFVGELASKTLTLMQAEVPDVLHVETEQGVIRIRGEASHGTSSVAGQRVGHIGKAFLLASPSYAGVVRAEIPGQLDAIGYYVLIVQPDGTVRAHGIHFAEARTLAWRIEEGDGERQFRLSWGAKVVQSFAVPAGPLRIGFAATVRRPGDRADLLVAFE